MYILLKSVNEYNQFGEYFEAAWDRKPSFLDVWMAAEVAFDIQLSNLDEGIATQMVNDLLAGKEVSDIGRYNTLRLLEYI